ncbi:MAG: GlcG/HbpS family heme-binding protein [Methylobacter sp.]
MDAAVNKAKETGTPSCIAVMDSGANLKAFRRMDDAWVGSIDVTIKKAKTACLFAMPSGDLGKLSQPNGQLYRIEHSNEGLITCSGGLPIVNELGVLIGVKVIVAGDLPKHPWRT